jgi:hypothetical protein
MKKVRKKERKLCFESRKVRKKVLFRIKKSEKERKKVSFRIKKSQKAIFLFARQTDGRGKGHIFHSFWSLQKKKNFLPQKSKKKKKIFEPMKKNGHFIGKCSIFFLVSVPKKSFRPIFTFSSSIYELMWRVCASSMVSLSQRQKRHFL